MGDQGEVFWTHCSVWRLGYCTVLGFNSLLDESGCLSYYHKLPWKRQHWKRCLSGSSEMMQASWVHSTALRGSTDTRGVKMHSSLEPNADTLFTHTHTHNRLTAFGPNTLFNRYKKFKLLICKVHSPISEYDNSHDKAKMTASGKY